MQEQNIKNFSLRKTYAIGDIHGCAPELETLLSRLEISAETLVIFLGDYIDRGFDSRGVIDLIIDLRKRCEVVALMGNHESMLLDFLEHPESVGAGFFILNGGSSTLDNYAGVGGSFEIPQTHIEFLKGLRLFYETPTHFFVHAGVPPEKKLRDLDPIIDRETLLWIRGPFLTNKESWDKVIVHGHSPCETPEKWPNRINVDTGCVFGRSLTAYDVNEDCFVSVDYFAHQQIVPPIQSETSRRIAIRFNGRMPVSAARSGGKRTAFETLNYNQFGLLFQETQATSEPSFETGDLIEGTIGEDPLTLVDFEGQIVRVGYRGDIANYGVKLNKISIDPGSNNTGFGAWLNRPNSK